ncbi:MAG TPA: c-type cytochrome, partial [Prosthecobacter sp.]|nr:c-type cytochrome [Prosthecobacter sp.]
AVYVIDWCDKQHCHSPAEEKWDRSNGRIYRISWADTYKPVKADLGVKTDLELAQLQKHANDWHARTARRLLQERAASRKIDAAAAAALKRQAPDLRALWTLHVIGEIDPLLADAARHENDIVRAWAVQMATEQAGEPRLNRDVLVAMARNDTSSTVRLALASALPMLDPETTWQVAAALSMHDEDQGDRFLPKMIWFGLARVIADDFARGLELAAKTPLTSLADSIHWYASTTAAGRELMAARVLDESKEAAARQIKLLAFGLKNEASAAMPKNWPAVRAEFSMERDLRRDLDQLAVIFGDKAVLGKMRDVLGDELQPLHERQRAFDLLRRSGDPQSTSLFVKLLDHEAFRSAVIPLLSRSDEPETAKALMALFEKLNPQDRSAALNSLTSRATLALPLLKALQAGEFDRKHLSALHVRQMRSLKSAEIDSLLDHMWGKINESPAAAKASIAYFKKAYESAPLWAYDARAGQETFKQVCAACHALNGVGGKLGPELAGSWRNGLDYFLENIIDPNAVIGDNFQMHVLTRKDGTVVSGVVSQETETAIHVQTVTELLVVAKADLKDRQKLAQSIMPPGLLEALPERKALELLKFLLSKQE